MNHFEVLVRAYLAQSRALEIKSRAGVYGVRDLPLSDIAPYLAHIANIASRILVGAPAIHYKAFIDKLNLRIISSNQIEVLNQAALLPALAWVLEEVVATNSIIHIEDAITAVIRDMQHGDELEEDKIVNEFLFDYYDYVIADIARTPSLESAPKFSDLRS